MVNSTCEHNDAASGGGCIYFGDSHEGVLLRDNVIKQNSALSGGGIYISRLCNDVDILECDIVSNMATNAGAVYSVASSIRMLSSKLQSNIAFESHGAVYVEAQVFAVISSTSISENTAAESSGGVTFDNCDNCTVTDSQLGHNTARFGNCGAIQIKESSTVTLHNTSLTSNYAAGSGGALCVDEFSNTIDVKGCMYMDNTAGMTGGAIYSLNSFSITVDKCSFVGNSISGIGAGSAIWLAGSSMLMSNNVFDGNKVLTGAGTVYWLHSTMTEPEGLFNQNNTFLDSNEAAYGPTIATEAHHMVLDEDQNVFLIVDYEQSAPPLTVYLVDYYAQVVTTSEDAVSVSAEVAYPDSPDCYDSPGFISGSVYSIFIDGVAVFDSLEPVCAPNYTLAINVGAAAEYIQDDVLVYYDFRPCVRGEYYADRICHSCENGSYSLADPGTEYELFELTPDVCESCPSEASHCHGDVIVLKLGYWRISSASDNIFDCPWHDESCVGGASVGSASCGDKYHGPLCAICDPDHHFVSSTEKCEPCGDGSSFIQPFTVALMIAILVAGFGCLWHYRRRKRGDNSPAISFDADSIIAALLVRCKIITKVDLSSRDGSNEVLEKIKRHRRRLLEQCVVYITFYQILSALSFVLADVEFPDVYSILVSVVSVVNLNINAGSLVTCSGSSQYDYVVQLVISTTYPIVFILLLMLMCQVHIWLTSARTRREIRSCQSIYIAILLIFIFLILPSGMTSCEGLLFVHCLITLTDMHLTLCFAVSIVIFNTFSCQDVGSDESSSDDIYMTADYSVSCSSNRYTFAYWWAIMMVSRELLNSLLM